MNSFSRYRQSRLVIGFVSLFSMALLSQAPFEKNPQNCEMISMAGKKKNKELPGGDNDIFLV